MYLVLPACSNSNVLSTLSFFKTIIDFPNKYSVSLGAVSTILLQARNNLAVIYIMKGQWKDAYQLLEYSGQIDNQEINYEIEQNKLLCTLLLNTLKNEENLCTPFHGSHTQRMFSR